MGNATSKAARKFPKRAEPPTWTSTASSSPQAFPKRPDQSIEQDAQDSNYMSNLARLGVAKVDHHMQAVRPHQKSREMIESRVQSEEEAASMHPSRNHIQASTLSYLLDKSKSHASRQEIRELADKYNVDIEKIEGLSRYFTTPSINPNSVVRKVRNEDGEEELSVLAIWVEYRGLKA
ncbi:hypothetical protein J3R30DRAFT_3433449 [Lentinula aciculospora]|uniref:Uncharacterized protein n=1 Tax=Lentinula aciculospora TaxID=153920 RepID=A0A9W9ARS3_9AGAR|nr:hypothetical protein J3R30DRAFT_3433449 [Lentinula aciculospora]